MLQDAVNCFQNYAGARDKKKRALFLEAEEWILDQDRRYFFSFENVCGSLSLDPNYLRQGLMRWKAAALETYHTRKLAS
jgi:site-specific DNA-cytosine methylase